MLIKRLLIANRGEIAVRIIKAAKDLNITTVQVYSQADADSLAVKLADESIDIGGAKASESYLNIEAIIKAAKQANVDAIHPGYGFLAEKAAFAKQVTENGFIFVGPDANTISQLGDKITARKIASQANVPVVPGSEGIVNNAQEGLEIAQKIGFPVLIKASAGGGGRGIRFIHNENEFTNLFHEAATESKAAFGNGDLYIEKVIENARHIEVQVLGDGQQFIHCFERECSLQRRRQKVWEEAPAQILDEKTRHSICQSAVNLVALVNYTGAGTVEYLYEEQTKSFYFIEVNTRIQVEHPITEYITGLDLVQEMLLIAGGQKLKHKQEDITYSGHAIECRINAEDPYNNFMPFPGIVKKLNIIDSPSTRFDTYIYEGYAIPPFYDSLIGKVIVKADSRQKAISKMENTLKQMTIEGLKTTIPLHIALTQEKDVINGKYDINWLENWLKTQFSSSEK